MSQITKLILIVGAALILIAVAIVGVLFVVSDGDIVEYVQVAIIRISLASRQDELNQPIGSSDAPIRFTVSPGDTPARIASQLVAANLITDADLFVDYVRVEQLDTQLEAGTYFLNQTQNVPTIAITLTDSRSSHILFRILEGWRIEEVASAVDQNGLFAFTGNDFLAVVGPGNQFDIDFVQKVGMPAGASLEGFLVPETYQLPPDITAAELRDTLIEMFLTVTDEQMYIDIASQGLTMYQAVIIASIVEREAVWEDENALVASVYRNRLATDYRLEADPTVQYGLNGSRGSWWPNITQADYQAVNSPYNTYIYTGLPPGPIASPGIAAIRAAIYPQDTDYFYFRAKCDGSNYHNFALTFAEHVANACQ